MCIFVCERVLSRVVWVNSSPTAGREGGGMFYPQGILFTYKHNQCQLFAAHGEDGILNNAHWVVVSFLYILGEYSCHSD